MLDSNTQEFIQAYIACALWSSSDNEPGYCEETAGYIEPTPLDSWHGELSLSARKKMHRRCHSFLNIAKPILEEAFDIQHGLDYSQAGHDFWLTHNGHGAGFWDGDWPKFQGDLLTSRAKSFSQIDLYIGDDERIYSS